MLRTLLCALAFTVPFSFGAEDRLLAFKKGEQLFVSKADGSGAKKLRKGDNPSIAPDGKSLAFTQYGSGSDDSSRHIAVMEIATGKTRIFKEGVPSDNSQRPAWSPNGSQILFHVYADGDWHIAAIDANGGNFRYVKKAGPNHNSYWSATWAADGKSFFAHDLQNLYRFDLQGSELKRWKVEDLFRNGSFNSGSQLAASPDGKRLLADVDMDEPVAVDGWNGPAPSVWVIDVAAGTSERLTPKGQFGSNGCWLTDDEIAFSSFSVKQRQPAIHRLTLGSKGSAVLVKNAEAPSASSGR